jgi:hypothetical protein
MGAATENENLALYHKFKDVPNEAKTEITAGNLKGYSDINPVWRIKKLTEEFGPCGIGWYTEITKEWTELGAKGEVIFFVKLKLYVKYKGEWSKPIEGTGGSVMINLFTKGLKSNDEALKMAETDALSVSCKKLGIGASVYFEKDKTKYDNVDDEKKPENKESYLDVLQKVKSIIWEVSGKNKTKSIELLKEFTEFTGRDKKLVEGLTDFDKLKGGRLKTTYNKLEKKYPDICEKVEKDLEAKAKGKKVS